MLEVSVHCCTFRTWSWSLVYILSLLYSLQPSYHHLFPSLCTSSPLRCSQTVSPLFMSNPRMAPLGLEPWYSRDSEGSIDCSLSPPPSMSCSSSALGKPNMKRADRKSKALQRRKPPHHAPIQRGSSGVMSSLPAQEDKDKPYCLTVNNRRVGGFDHLSYYSMFKPLTSVAG